MIDITPNLLRQMMPGCKEPNEWAPILSRRLLESGIVEPQQIAAFIAQTGHESLNYNILSENLNYSVDGLMTIFPKYFRDVRPLEYARQPVKIASRVYANRMGNGNEASQDGWKFRGRGVLQVTGKNNYRDCSLYIFGDEGVLLKDPDLLLEKDYALMSALWYWDINKLKKITSFLQLTKAINGGTNGYEDRKNRFVRAIEVLENR
jgi:putative chitinase